MSSAAPNYTPVSCLRITTFLDGSAGYFRVGFVESACQARVAMYGDIKDTIVNTDDYFSDDTVVILLMVAHDCCFAIDALSLANLRLE